MKDSLAYIEKPHEWKEKENMKSYEILESPSTNF